MSIVRRQSWRSMCARSFSLFALLLTTVAISVAASAQTFKTVFSFDNTNGSGPNNLVQGLDGNLYATTFLGGANFSGTFFKITPGGIFTSLHTFGPDGSNIAPALVLATNGSFYGTAENGGAFGDGTAFEITPTGKVSVLHNFCSKTNCVDGYFASSGLVQAGNGNFYGTTASGGAYEFDCKGRGPACGGTVFELTSGGKLTTLHSFCSHTNCADGATPYGGLIQASNGNFYGTTYYGGTSSLCTDGCGTIFRITPAGTFTTLHSFDGTDGSGPEASLVQGSDGWLYGSTSQGGDDSKGTIFKISTSGTFVLLHSFNGTDGLAPYGALIQGTDGNFYGTTVGGGVSSNSHCSYITCGTVFRMTTHGTLTTLHSFTYTDGTQPMNALTQDTDGSFWGTTNLGGPYSNSSGTIFRITVGLGPFVETLPASGAVGQTIRILGTSLNGATAVYFNGTKAAFKVISSSEITATVPSGATSGKVEVVTPKGTLKSNKIFRVT